MSGSNRRRAARPALSILPPLTGGAAHYERVIDSRSVATGARVRSVYLATGEYRADLELRQPGALSARNLLRVGALVHDADLADWLIGSKLDEARISQAHRLVDGSLFDARSGARVPAGATRASGAPVLSDAAAVKACLWRMPAARLEALLREQLADVCAALLDHYGQPPSILTCSGYGYHALYWLPPAAGRMDDDSPTGGRAARAVNAAAVAAMNARAGFELFDPACIDAGTRILREIGTSNDKGGRPRVVSLVESHTEQRLEIEPLSRRAPAARVVSLAPPASAAATAPASSARASGLPDGYTGDVRSLDIVALMRGAGLYIGPAGGSGHYVRCPWAADHSSSDARAWVGPADHRWPRFACKHASCSSRDLLELLHHFGAARCMAHTAEEYTPRGAEHSGGGGAPPPPPAGAELEPPPRIFDRGDAVELSSALVTDELSSGAVYDRSRFWRYNPDSGAWHSVPDAAIRRRLRRYAGAWVHAGVDKDGADKFRPLKLSQAALEGARAAAADLLFEPRFFSSAEPACGFYGGAIRPDGALVKPAPENRILDSWCLPFPLQLISTEQEIEARAPAWCRFLSTAFAGDDDSRDKSTLVMEFVGVALLGWATRFERALVCQGHGGCGKSTFAKAISAIFPPDAVCSVPLHRLAQRFGAAPIAEARLNLVTDLPSSDIVDAGDLKAIITGDLVSFERKGRDPYSAAPTAAHIILANDLPAVRDRSDGFWSRFLVLKFNRRFRGSNDQDRGMADKLRGEREHIAAACIYHGLRAVERGDYTIPASTRSATAAWQRDQNTVSQWIAEQTSRPESAILTTQGKALFSDYKAWAVDAGYRPLGRNKFYGELSRAGIERRTVDGATHFALSLVVPHLRAV